MGERANLLVGQEGPGCLEQRPVALAEPDRAHHLAVGKTVILMTLTSPCLLKRLLKGEGVQQNGCLADGYHHPALLNRGGDRVGCPHLEGLGLMDRHATTNLRQLQGPRCMVF